MSFSKKQKVNSQLNLAYWWVSHQLLIKKILLGLFIAFDVILIIFAVYGLIKIFSEKPLVWQDTAIHFSQPPQALEILETEVLSLGNNRYDLVARIRNPNANFTVLSFDYQFVGSNFASAKKQSFVLPNEEKFIAELRVKSDAPLDFASLEISNVRWLRISKVVPLQDYEIFRQNRLNIEIKDKIFTPAVHLQISGGLPLSKSSFTIINQTAYSYYDVGIFVTLYQNEKLIGVNYLKIDNFLSGQTRPIELNWLQILPTRVEIQVEPEVNIFDEETYIRPL